MMGTLPHFIKYDKSAGKLVQELLPSLGLGSEVFRPDLLGKRNYVAYALKDFGYCLIVFKEN